MNCFVHGPEDDPNSVGLLYHTISLFNHSCRSNIDHFYSGPYQRVYALRDIKPGEELCHCYITAMMPYCYRQAELLNSYNFECDCPVCCLEECDRKFSDQRRKRYQMLFRYGSQKRKKSNNDVGKKIFQL